MQNLRFVLCAGMVLLGCGGTSQPPPPAGQPATAQQPTAPPAPAPATPTAIAATSPGQPSPVASPAETTKTPEPQATSTLEVKPVVIALAGADGHGKTMLLAAISQSGAKHGHGKAQSYDQLNAARGAEVALGVAAQPLLLKEYPDHQALVQVLGRGLDLGGLILVVAQAEGIAQQTREQIAAAGKGKVRVLAVAQTKDDLVDDAELKDLEQSEIEEALVQAGLLAEKDAGTWEKGKYKPGTKLPFIRLSAKRALGGDTKSEAAVAALVAAVEKRLGGSSAH